MSTKNCVYSEAMVAKVAVNLFTYLPKYIFNGIASHCTCTFI